MTGRQRSHIDKPFSLLLAMTSYMAGMFTGSIATTLSSTSKMRNYSVMCGSDEPPHRSMQPNGNDNRSLDFGNSTSASAPFASGEPRTEREMNDFGRLENTHMAEMSNAISMENSKARKENILGGALEGDPPYSEVVRDIVPDVLLPRYASDLLQFPVTRSMLRQSRVIGGNSERLHAYLKKLQSKQCTTVLFLGGSVTKGHQAGGYVNAYPRFFVDWLNARYPCRSANGTTGSHRAKFTSSSSSQEIAVNWPVVDGIESFDLAFLEFNINDSFIPSNPHALEDKGPAGDTPEYRNGWYTEIVLRRLLLLRKPDPVAVVVFSADYVGSQWADRSVAGWAKEGAIEEARKSLFRRNAEPVKAWLSSLYMVPAWSASVWLLPLHGKKGMRRQFMRGNRHSTAAWHWGKECCHPHREGHLLLSLVLAYCFVDEERFVHQYNGTSTERIEHDFTADDTPRLRDPVYLSPEEDDLYVQNRMEVNGLDFTDPSGEKLWKSSIVFNNGWSFYADNPHRDKFGLNTNDVLGKSHIAISIVGGEHGLVEVSYVMSYENFGDSLAWVAEPGRTERHHLCDSREHVGTQQRPDVDRLSGIWKERASIPTVTVLKQRVETGAEKYLHICLLPLHKSRPWKENKFKLLGVRIY